MDAVGCMSAREVCRQKLTFNLTYHVVIDPVPGMNHGRTTRQDSPQISYHHSYSLHAVASVMMYRPQCFASEG